MAQALLSLSSARPGVDGLYRIKKARHTYTPVRLDDDLRRSSSRPARPARTRAEFQAKTLRAGAQFGLEKAEGADSLCQVCVRVRDQRESLGSRLPMRTVFTVLAGRNLLVVTLCSRRCNKSRRSASSAMGESRTPGSAPRYRFPALAVAPWRLGHASGPPCFARYRALRLQRKARQGSRAGAIALGTNAAPSRRRH